MQDEKKFQKSSPSGIGDDNLSRKENEPVTVLITRKPKPGREAEFETVIKDIGEVVGKFPGFLGLDVVRPMKPGKEAYHVVFHFDNQSNFKRWESSSERAEWQSSADALIEPESKRVERVNGLEAWFTLPNQNGTPPKWKTAIISLIGIYPLMVFMPDLMSPVISSLPEWLRALVMIIVMSPIITWVMMPFVTWIFKSWLYPSATK